jgi:ComF family protein
VLPRLAKFKEAALNLLFPQKCLGCGREGGLICDSCQRSLSRLNPPICPKCGRPQLSGILCPTCVSWRANLEGIRSPFKFEGLIRESIHQLKYKNLRSLAQPLSVFLLDYLSAQPLPFDIIVPVPLHPRRLKERGYNQSLLLASAVAKSLGVRLEENSLIRHKYILPQAKTPSVAERRRNVSQAFSCRHPFEGKQVLLIDDVSTSGSTLDACAAALKSGGADSVWGLVLAREI